MNPDGVINGNSRCSIEGRDLNRAWLLNADKNNFQ
jgi:murein tripeptide amidase MpaA